MRILTSLWVRMLILNTVFTLVFTACAAAPQFDKVYKTIAPASLQAGQVIPAPKAPVLLTVTGKIGAKNQSDHIVMDLPPLEAVGVVEYTVSDPFENRKIVYR